MHSFVRDRDVIIALPAQYAKAVLRMLDSKTGRSSKTPAELRKAVAAAQRCPDVARFFLMEKLHTCQGARR